MSTVNMGDNTPRLFFLWCRQGAVSTPQNDIDVRNFILHLSDRFGFSPCPGIVLGLSARTKHFMTILLFYYLDHISWLRTRLSFENLCGNFMPIEKNHSGPIPCLFNEIFIKAVDFALLLLARVTATHANQMKQIVILFSVLIKAAYVHGRKVGFFPIPERCWPWYSFLQNSC